MDFLESLKPKVQDKIAYNINKSTYVGIIGVFLTFVFVYIGYKLLK